MRGPSSSLASSARRHRGLALLISLVVLGGCSGSNGDAGEPVDGDRRETITIDHRFGETEVPAEPVRIVAVGATDADTLVALGVTPVGAVPEPDGADGELFAWIDGRPEVAGTEPLTLDSSYRVDPEEVRLLEPDLILAVNLYTDAEAQYEDLSAIAPTVASSVDPSTMSWADHAVEVGTAIGRERDARALVADVEGQIEAVAAENPQFAGKTLSFGGVFDSTGATMVFGEGDFSRVFLAQLGFTVPPAQLAELPALAAEGEDQAPVSLERLELLDGDVLVLAFFGDGLEEELTGRDLFQQIPAVAEGRFVSASVDVVSALRLPSVMSIPFVLDELVPQVRAVVPT